MRVRRMSAALALTTAVALAVAACGSSGSSGGGSGASATPTYKLGVLVDETGAAGAAGAVGIKGVQAYVNYVNSEGGVNGAKLSMSVADTTSTPAGALAAAQKLVESDHAFAVIAISSFFFGAQSYLLKAGVPVMGLGYDGPEWNDPQNTNLFSYDVIDYTKVYSTAGEYFKSQGVTKCATVGYSDSPSAAASAQANQKSCEAAGLQAPYIDLVKFTTTDVGPIALAIKSSGADGLYLPIEPSTGFALAGALQAQGVHMKATLFPIGYGQSLLSSSAAVKGAQGYSFTSMQTPTELNTPATQLQSKWLQSVGLSGPPDLNFSVGWLSTAVFAAGMQAAGPNASQAEFTTKLRAVTGFTAGGLLPEPVNFADYSPTKTCQYVVKLSGSAFVPVQKAPFCGGVVGTLPS
jgi:branched-chain amino acid transport system substrate-binding protein